MGYVLGRWPCGRGGTTNGTGIATGYRARPILARNGHHHTGQRRWGDPQACLRRANADGGLASNHVEVTPIKGQHEAARPERELEEGDNQLVLRAVPSEVGLLERDGLLVAERGPDVAKLDWEMVREMVERQRR